MTTQPEPIDPAVQGDRPELILILSAPRSFSSVVCAMLGQHPELYGIAETQLFSSETIAGWWDMCGRATFPMAHGLLRAVAELLFGGQNAYTVKQAAIWLRKHSDLETAEVMKALGERVRPLILVEKSPSIVYSLESMRRAANAFPGARLIHLTRHPRGYCESVDKHLRESAKRGLAPQWLLNLGHYGDDGQTDVFDPQWSWHTLNTNICAFLESVPASHQLRVRGEDVLAGPDRILGEIATWLGLRADPEAIEEMKHPERSPFATFGPPGARFGNDLFFLRRPRLRPERAEAGDLVAPLQWRDDGSRFSEQVVELAQTLGYA